MLQQKGEDTGSFEVRASGAVQLLAAFFVFLGLVVFFFGLVFFFLSVTLFVSISVIASLTGPPVRASALVSIPATDLRSGFDAPFD